MSLNEARFLDFNLNSKLAWASISNNCFFSESWIIIEKVVLSCKGLVCILKYTLVLKSRSLFISLNLNTWHSAGAGKSVNVGLEAMIACSEVLALRNLLC